MWGFWASFMAEFPTTTTCSVCAIVLMYFDLDELPEALDPVPRFSARPGARALPLRLHGSPARPLASRKAGSG